MKTHPVKTHPVKTLPLLILITATTLAEPATAQSGAASEGMHQSQAGGAGHGQSHGQRHGQDQQSGGMHSMVRHHYVMREGLPEEYRDVSNPLTATDDVLANGSRIYAENCAICHGETGVGDGPAGLTLDPSPSNIQRLPRMPMMSSDPYFYWTVSEGGLPIETGMTPFGQTLTPEEIWSVILYVREGL